ncbi:PREDICTED: histone-lysine N-methyltransferase ATXR3 [Prunus dulcis]|nr:PREDICTED: histone-lysine N-methyltransferase ATXR3 [Prunus dulcis]
MGKHKGWKFERERTPPSGKYSNDDAFRRKEFDTSGSQQSKSTARWEIGSERNIRITSNIVDEDGV